MGDARLFTGVPIYLAVEKGYFREQGIDMQFEPMTGGDSAAYLGTGQIDIALDASPCGPLQCHRARRGHAHHRARRAS